MRGKNEFEDLADNVYNGNRYAACMYVAKEARRRAAKCEDSVLDSESISWVLTGKRNVPKKDQKKLIEKWYSNQYDILNYVENKDIRTSVSKSLGISKSLKHLVYAYEKSLNESEQARVRVLTNILWYQSKEANNDGNRNNKEGY